MKNFDYLALDGQTILTFLTVLREQSVSAAADRLGVTQSAVSHTLTKLRHVLGDALFVRQGRGISPTKRAYELRQPMEAVLDQLKGMTHERSFDPRAETITFTVAANDHQRRLLFPELFRSARVKGVDLRLHFVDSGVPSVELLNQGRCQLIVTPFPPDAPKAIQTRLFQDEVVCFFDRRHRVAPTSWPELIACDRVDVQFHDGRNSLATMPPNRVEKLNPAVCTVSNFVGLSEFILGTDLITIQSKLLGQTFLSDLDYVSLPFPVRRLQMYMVWHRRDHTDPAHRWLRDQVQLSAKAYAIKEQRELDHE